METATERHPLACLVASAVKMVVVPKCEDGTLSSASLRDSEAGETPEAAVASAVGCGGRHGHATR